MLKNPSPWRECRDSIFYHESAQVLVVPSRSQTGGEIIDSQRSEAGKKISVIVPVYNEEDNVGPLFEALFPILSKLTPDFETIAVNDGSTDRSCARLIALAKQHPEVKVVNFRRNFGQPFSNSISPADWRMQICESAREFIVSSSGASDDCQ